MLQMRMLSSLRDEEGLFWEAVEAFSPRLSSSEYFLNNAFTLTPHVPAANVAARREGGTCVSVELSSTVMLSNVFWREKVSQARKLNRYR